jgi:hypothetical protein
LSDTPSTASVRGRLIALHELLTAEMIRNANDNAIKILKEIAAEARLLKCGERVPDAPTADPKIRLTYWHELFERMRKGGQVERSVDMLREIRKESQLCK